MSFEWRTVSLGQCAELDLGYPFKSADYTDSKNGARLLRGDNIGQGQLRWDGVRRWLRRDGDRLATYELREKDLVLAMDRPWITAGLKFARVRTSDLPSLLVQRVARLRPKEGVDADYLHSVIASADFTQHIQTITTGTAVPHISGKQIQEYKFDLPDIATQRAIGSLLIGFDDRITLLRETNATLEAIAQALFKSWFVDFDPVRAKLKGRAPEGMDEATAALFPDGFEESELGLVPKGWRVGTLGDVAQTVRQQLQPADMHADIHCVGLEHIPRKSLSLASWGTADGLESAKATFSDGDILFGKLRPYFHKVVIAPFDGVCSTDILVCQAKKSAYYGFVAMQLFSTALVEYAERLSNGAKMPRVGWKDLAAYPVVLPSEPVAVEYTRAIEPLLARMKANVHEAQTLATLRDTLLPRLISGALRLPSSE